MAVWRTMSNWGFQTAVVHDGLAAWEYLTSSDSASLAIVDWEMPGLEGPELCRRVRLDKERAHLYLILLTARNTPTDLIAGLEAGADDYLIKPVDRGELEARLHVASRVIALQERLSDRVLELEEALRNVRQLQGLLPICAYCKRIRDDKNYWSQVETYLADHSDVQFSHGICPSCFERVMREDPDLRQNP
jgi:DNA-binding response OmpR family regulator